MSDKLYSPTIARKRIAISSLAMRFYANQGFRRPGTRFDSSRRWRGEMRFNARLYRFLCRFGFHNLNAVGYWDPFRGQAKEIKTGIFRYCFRCKKMIRVDA